MKKIKQNKKKKLDSIPKINRRLFKLWSIAVREKAGNKCEFCNATNGDNNGHGIVNKLDAHHLLSRKIKNSPLKFDIRNGILVDPFHHKFGIPSFHRDPVTTITWLQKNRPDRYQFVLENSLFTVDLDNRKVLEEIETRLNKQEPLDFSKLKEIESQFPRIVNTRKPKNETKGTLFDENDEESSSSGR